MALGFWPFSRIWFIISRSSLCASAYSSVSRIFSWFMNSSAFLRCCCKLPFSFLLFGFVVYLKCCFLCKARRSRVLVVLWNAHGGADARVCLSGGADLRQLADFRRRFCSCSDTSSYQSSLHRQILFGGGVMRRARPAALIAAACHSALSSLRVLSCLPQCASA